MHMTDNEIIDQFGGTTVVARMFDLTTGAISQWRSNGIPPGWRKCFMLMRPELFAPPTPAPDREAA
jgi:hypothetical protein